jgi:hypothetical protein
MGNEKTLEVRSGSVTIKRVNWSESWFEGLQQKARLTREVWGGFRIGSGEAQKQLALAMGPVGVMAHKEQVLSLLLGLKFDLIPNGWLVGLFKELSEMAKKWGEILWPEYWSSMTSFELFFGAPPVKEANFQEQITGWVETPKPGDDPRSDTRRVVEEGLREVARKEFVFKDQLGINEFLRSPSKWLANGATTGERLPGSKGTKFSTYLASSREELLKDLFSTAEPQNVVNPKRERGKTRNTVSSDWDLYLQMKYVCQGVEEALESVFPTTLGKKVQQLERWRMWRNKLGGSVGVPIDQSTFDHVPWMDLLVAMIRLLAEAARKKSPEPEVHQRITEIIIMRVRSATVNWEGYTWRHLRGLLSGWALTSALGTLLNYIEFVGITVVTGGSMPSVDELCLQGDDDLIFAHSWNSAVTLVKTYMRVLPVNPGKFFVSTQRTEFLRMVITKDRVTGYAARAIPSLVYANAWAGGKMTVQSTVSAWARLVQRGCPLAQVREHAIRDVCGFTRAPRQHVEDLLATPKSVGGLGLEVGPSRRWRRVVEDNVSADGPFETRRVALTDAEKVPARVRQIATSNIQTHGGLFADRGVARAAADAVLSGVQGTSWGAQMDTLIRIESVEVKPVAHLLDGRFVNVAPPRATIDPMFVPSVLRELMKGGWKSVSQLFFPRDHERIRTRWSAWSRAVWFDWVTGRLKPKGWSDWRMGSVVASAVSDAVGYQLWLPRGKVSRDSVTVGMLATESHSRRYHAEDLQWMGG